jgi:uncharacterized OB-fold protein
MPQATTETAAYWAATQERRLVIQRCASCGHCQFYPRAFCIECLSERIEWINASGQGRIYSYTVCRIAPSPAFEARLPYVVALIDLDEGVRMLANLLDVELEEVAIGARVGLCFEAVSESCTLPQFTLLD